MIIHNRRACFLASLSLAFIPMSAQAQTFWYDGDNPGWSLTSYSQQYVGNNEYFSYPVVTVTNQTTWSIPQTDLVIYGWYCFDHQSKQLATSWMPSAGVYTLNVTNSSGGVSTVDVSSFLGGQVAQPGAIDTWKFSHLGTGSAYISGNPKFQLTFDNQTYTGAIQPNLTYTGYASFSAGPLAPGQSSVINPDYSGKVVSDNGDALTWGYFGDSVSEQIQSAPEPYEIAILLCGALGIVLRRK